jgi:hypothetical protein
MRGCYLAQGANRDYPLRVNVLLWTLGGMLDAGFHQAKA